MAASITAKTVTATGTVQGGRTRLKAFYVKQLLAGHLRWCLKTAVAVLLYCRWCFTHQTTIRLPYLITV